MVWVNVKKEKDVSIIHSLLISYYLWIYKLCRSIKTDVTCHFLYSFHLKANTFLSWNLSTKLYIYRGMFDRWHSILRSRLSGLAEWWKKASTLFTVLFSFMQMFVYTMACNSRKNSFRKKSIVVCGEMMAARDLELDSSAININETWRTSMNLLRTCHGNYHCHTT